MGDRVAEEPDEVDLLPQHVARQHRGERGVLEHVGELGRAEAGVHGDHLDAEQRAAEERCVVLDAVRRDDPHTLAAPDPERVQTARDPVGLAEELDRRQPPLGERDRDALGPRPGRADEDVAERHHLGRRPAAHASSRAACASVRGPPFVPRHPGSTREA
jgi:hypothetical protein